MAVGDVAGSNSSFISRLPEADREAIKQSEAEDFNRTVQSAASRSTPPKVKPKKAEDGSDQKFYNMAADYQNAQQDKAASLEQSIDALGTSGGYATEVMRDQATRIETELLGQALNDYWDLLSSNTASPADLSAVEHRIRYYADLTGADGELGIRGLIERSLENKAESLQQDIDALGTSGGRVTEVLQNELNGIQSQITSIKEDRLRQALVNYVDIRGQELGGQTSASPMSAEQAAEEVRTAASILGRDGDEILAPYMMNFMWQEQQIENINTYKDYIENKFDVSPSVANDIVDFVRGDTDKIEGLPSDVQDALSNVDIRMVNSSTRQPFMVGPEEEMRTIHQYFGNFGLVNIYDGQQFMGIGTEYPPAFEDRDADWHTILDIGGMIPVIGEAADAINGVYYAVEGDWKNAGISAGGLLRLGGQWLTGGRLAAKGADAALHADEVVEGTAGAIARHGDDVVPELTAGNQLTLSLDNIRQIPDPNLRGWAAEQHVGELYGAQLQQVEFVGVNNRAGRFIDQAWVRPNGDVLFIEVKNYSNPVSLPGRIGTTDANILDELIGDTAIRKADPRNQPIWVFTDAGPTGPLRDALVNRGIIVVEFK